MTLIDRVCYTETMKLKITRTARALCVLIIVLISAGCLSAPEYMNKTLPPEERAALLLAEMTLEEKAGQMTQIDRSFIYPLEDIATYGFGSILSGGGSGPNTNNPLTWAAMYDLYQEQALQSRLKIPVIYGVDAVHGHNNVKGATIFPHNIGLGATRNEQLVEDIARATAVETAATGIDWTFAPTIAVPRDERWGRTYEGFSEDPALVAALGAAAVRGYQGAPGSLADPRTILATAKHFAGDGGTTGGSDRGNTELPEEEFYDIHMSPYPAALEAGAGSVMVSFSRWNNIPMHANGELISDVLKDRWGFDGIVVSDWGAVGLLRGSEDQKTATAINAGIDMVMVPDNYRDFIPRLVRLVEEGKISQERIDDAVMRILTIKFRLGLFEKPLVDKKLIDEVGSEKHRALARQAVRESAVLLKNMEGTLPLNPDIGHLHVAGALADDLGSQCGGWTITWQGRSGESTIGTTILEGLQAGVSETTKVTFSKDGSGGEGADAVVLVVGEKPYAEMEGDRRSLHLSEEHRTIIDMCLGYGVPLTIVLISGRPLIVTEEIEKVDAFLAAWLPGTEGAGLADVLLGEYAPTGTLSFTWPASMEDIPINKDDGKTGYLFSYGFGLSY